MIFIDMKKPETCEQCRFCEYEQGHCTALPQNTQRKIEDMAQCPLIEATAPCFLESPCEYQNPDCIIPNCKYCKNIDGEDVCTVWMHYRGNDGIVCSMFEVDNYALQRDQQEFKKMQAYKKLRGEADK